MKKISTNRIGFIILSSFILIAPLLTNPAYSLNTLPPGTSISPQTSTIESAARGTGIELGDLGGIELGELGGTELGDLGDIELGDIELGDNVNRNNLIENLLEANRALALNPRDDLTRENLREFLSGSITNKALANQIAGNVEALEEEGRLGDLSIARSIQEREFNKLESLESAVEAATVVSSLNGIFSKCTADNDMAVHTIKGKTDFNKILGNIKNNNNDDISIELIVDFKPTETSLVLVGSPTVFLKGIISTDPYDSDPKEYKYDISHTTTDCITKTLTNKPLQIDSGITKPLVIPDEARITGANAQFFKPCTPAPPAAGSSDFAKFKLIGNVENKDLSINGKVDLAVKIFVDYSVGTQLPSKDPATVEDDNRIVAMQLIANEGENAEKKFNFIPKDAITECDTVTFLQDPQNIANNEVFGDPLYGFKKKG